MECTPKGGNTGIGKCDLGAQRIDTIVFVPRNAKIPKTTTDIMAFMLEKFKADSTLDRWYPFAFIAQATDNTEDAQMGTFGYGSTVKQRNGYAMFGFDMPFTKCLAEAAIDFDGWSEGVFFISSDGNLLCRESIDGESWVPLIPETPVYVTRAQLINVGTTDLQVVAFSVNMGDNLQFAKKTKVVPIGNYDKAELIGLIDLKLTIAAKSASYVDVKVETSCGGENIFEAYETELSSDSLWNIVNSNTGATVTISGIQPQAGNQTFRVAATFTVGTTYKLSLVKVSQLEAANVIGYEGQTVTFTA